MGPVNRVWLQFDCSACHGLSPRLSGVCNMVASRHSMSHHKDSLGVRVSAFSRPQGATILTFSIATSD